MKLEEIQNNSYPFFFLGGQNSSYVFVTDLKISYEIKFKSSSYLFDNRLDFKISVHEFVIEVAINPTGKRPALDARIPYTIASIFIDFFEKDNEQAIVYICDSSDIRQEARRRKFNQWVELFKGNHFIKVDTEIVESPIITYHNSITLRADNPRRGTIVDAFIELANDYKK
jgi:hypothetical protein